VRHSADFWDALYNVPGPVCCARFGYVLLRYLSANRVTQRFVASWSGSTTVTSLFFFLLFFWLPPFVVLPAFLLCVMDAYG
jgi:hypothetical protein